ncbi:MAG: fibronectin type III domain-containing protein [Sandaracinaceae bacterium]
MTARLGQASLLGFVILFGSGCLLDRTELGGAPIDAGGLDAGFQADAGVDAGTEDAGMPDAGLPDAGLPDAGMPDAGLPDASPDGGSDAAVPDAGPPLEVPGAPGAPTFGAITLDTLTASWAAPTTGGAPTAYEIQRATVALGTGALMDIGTAAERTFDDSGLRPNTGYVYRVRAVNAAGAGAYSETAVATTEDFDPVTRVQFETSGRVDDPTATWMTSPIEGNLLVAIGFQREDEATPSIPGWDLRVDAASFSGDNSNRRQLVVFTRIATAGEPSTVQLDWEPNRESVLVLEEFAGGGTWEFVAAASNDTRRETLSTLTVSLAAVADDYTVVSAFGSRDAPGGVNWIGLTGSAGVSGTISLGGAFGSVTHPGGTLTQTVNWGVNRRATAAIAAFRRVP